MKWEIINLAKVFQHKNWRVQNKNMFMNLKWMPIEKNKCLYFQDKMWRIVWIDNMVTKFFFHVKNQMDEINTNNEVTGSAWNKTWTIPNDKHVNIIAWSNNLHLGLLMCQSICVCVIYAYDAISSSQSASFSNTPWLNLDYRT